MGKRQHIEGSDRFASYIAGIPCIIVVETAGKKGSYSQNEVSDLDYYGYDPVWYVLDRKGYQAEWLFKKATGTDKDRILEEIENWSND